MPVKNNSTSRADLKCPTCKKLHQDYDTMPPYCSVECFDVEARKKAAIYKPLPRDAYGNTIDDYTRKIFEKKAELELLRKRYEDLKKHEK